MKARIDEFLIDVKPQKEWGWAVITYLFLGGAGAGLFLVSLYMRHSWGEGLGLLVLVLGTLFLLIDLGRPERFWRAFFRPRTSWISRGCFFITALVLLGGLEILFAQFSLGEGAWPVLIRATAALAAVAVMVYTGFVLSPSPAIPFWNSAFFPVIFFAYSLLAGIDFLILASPLLPGPDIDLALLEKVQFGLVFMSPHGVESPFCDVRFGSGRTQVDPATYEGKVGHPVHRRRDWPRPGDSAAVRVADTMDFGVPSDVRSDGGSGPASTIWRLPVPLSGHSCWPL